MTCLHSPGPVACQYRTHPDARRTGSYRRGPEGSCLSAALRRRHGRLARAAGRRGRLAVGRGCLSVVTLTALAWSMAGGPGRQRYSLRAHAHGAGRAGCGGFGGIAERAGTGDGGRELSGKRTLRRCPRVKGRARDERGLLQSGPPAAGGCVSGFKLPPSPARRASWFHGNRVTSDVRQDGAKPLREPLRSGPVRVGRL